MLVQRRGQGAVEIFARGKAAMLDDAGRDTVAARTLESLGGGAVRDDEADFSTQLVALDGVDYSLQIGAGAGNQHPQPNRRPLLHRAMLPCGMPRVSAYHHAAFTTSDFAHDASGR